MGWNKQRIFFKSKKVRITKEKDIEGEDNSTVTYRSCCVWSEHRCVYTSLIHDSSSPSD